MPVSQQISKFKLFYKATAQQRLIAAIVFFAIAVFSLFCWLAANDKIDIEFFTGPCGLKQRYGLPCPTCGITSATLSFFRGQVLESFYIQPAGAFLCCLVVASGFLAFITAVFGVYFFFLKGFFEKIKARYIILAFLIIIAAGWAVTLTRVLAEKY